MCSKIVTFVCFSVLLSSSVYAKKATMNLMLIESGLYGIGHSLKFRYNGVEHDGVIGWIQNYGNGGQNDGKVFALEGDLEQKFHKNGVVLVSEK